MEERSTFDILLDYPKKHGLEYHTNDTFKRFYLFPNDPTLSIKFVSFKVGENLWFHAYDSYAAKAYLTKTFSGLYSSIDLDSEINLKAYKKEWFDFILRKYRRKTGNKLVDSRLTITCPDHSLPRQLIKAEEAKLFRQLEKCINPLTFLIKQDYLPIIEELEGKSVVGLEAGKWIYEESQVDYLIEKGAELLDGLKRNA